MLSVNVIEQLPFFAGKTVCQMVALPGYSHHNWQVITRQEHFFVRQYLPDKLQLSRFREIKCQLAAAKNGFSPEPLAYYAERGILITRFLPDAQPFCYNAHHSELLATSVAQFHRFTVKAPLLQSVDYLYQLRHAITESDLFDPALFSQLEQAAIAHAAVPQDLVLCHRDLSCDNILFSHNQLYLIDFEYVCRADYSFDLATVIVHNDLSDTESLQWLNQYRQQRPLTDTVELMIQKVRLAEIIYCGWCWLWYLMNPRYRKLAQHWQVLLQQRLDNHSF